LASDISFFSARRRGRLLAIGALRELDKSHGELKSMHTAAEARGQGIGRALLGHLVSVAVTRGYERLSLETGTLAAFEPARSLYAGAGFAVCEPFGEYRISPNSLCMTMVLNPEVRSAS
jgi:putative acetyltransferase